MFISKYIAMDNMDDGLIHLTNDSTINNEINIDNLGKEESRQMIRKLMAKMLSDETDDNIKDGCDILTKALNNYDQLDQNMIARLNDIFSNDLIKKKEYSDIIKAIGQGSTVVYFKSAQLFKVYKKTELESLLGGQLRTIYKQLNESFEMVPNESKQKIVMLCDSSLEDKIEPIKTHIVQFMINEGITQFTDNDIVCYKGKDALEIIINDYYVDSQEEHDKIVQKLLKYITQQEKSSNIERYIATGTYSEFDGVKMIPMPSEKELFATNYIEPLLTMISNVQECNGFKNQIHLNVTINNNNVDNSVDNSINTTNNTTIHESQESNENNLYDFIKHIREDRPDWYKESKWIKKDIILEKYNEIYENISKRAMSMMFKDILYKHEKRQAENKIRYMFVKLIKIENL
jgi:hypothetical protein